MICKIDSTSRDAVNAFIIKQWFTLDMVVHGESIDLSTADGFYSCENDEINGLITYRITNNEMEILSLDSLLPNKGYGTELLSKNTHEMNFGANGLIPLTAMLTGGIIEYLNITEKSFVTGKKRIEAISGIINPNNHSKSPFFLRLRSCCCSLRS